MKKRGQVTIFLILALIAIVIVVIYYGLSQTVLKDKFQAQIEAHKNVPAQIQPINDYLDSCTLDVAKEGIAILAQQGGYITLPVDSTPTSSFNPVEATLPIFSFTELRVPFWFREQPNGVQTTNAPTTEQMQDELATYIENNYNRCLDNLTAFSEQGFDFVISGNPKATVTIRDKLVDVSVALPVEVSKEGIKFSLESHLAQIQSRLGELHSMAIEILNKENEGLFLENKTIDLMVAYDPAIPFSGSSTSCTEQTWSKRNVITQLKNVISENVAAFRVKGTNYALQDKKYEYLVFDPLSSSHNDVTVNMMYSQKWPTDIEITPSDGDLLKEDSVTKQTGSQLTGILSSFFCLTTHRFVYTIKYPVLITLTDPDGLSFQFATEVIIDRNVPRENRVLMEDTPDTSSELCKYPATQVTVETYALSSTGDIVPVNDADIYFKCYPATCKVNVQKVADNRFIAAVPACLNGVIEARKPGYYNGKTTGVSTNTEITNVIPIILTPIYKKNVKVFVIDKATGEIRKPYDSETVTFQFTHNMTDAPYTTTFNYPTDDNTIELIPGPYVITSYVLGNSTWPIVMPKQTSQHCTTVGGFLGVFGGQEQCVTTEIPEVKINTAIKGGAVFSYDFQPADLGKDSDLVLYTMASPIPSDTDSMAKIYDEVQTNSEDPRFRYPEL